MTEQTMIPIDIDPLDVADLRAAAAEGPGAWKRGVASHLATVRRHGTICLTCCAYALGYGLDWEYEGDCGAVALDGGDQ